MVNELFVGCMSAFSSDAGTTPATQTVTCWGNQLRYRAHASKYRRTWLSSRTEWKRLAGHL